MSLDPRAAIDQAKQALTTANTLQFPSSMGVMYSQFSFVQYSRNNPKTQATSASTTADIFLPLPFNLKEQYAINYSGSDLSWVEGGRQAIEKVLSEGASVTETRDKAYEALQAFARSTFSDSRIVRQLDRTTGTVVNPHIVNIFQNVNLRTHNFQWSLSPTSESEAQILLNIIRKFRERMHPDLRDGSFILGFPDEVYVTMHGSSFLYPVFKSVIQDIQIDYTDGRPNAWFTDGAPVTVTLSITLQEVETLTREDFTGPQTITTGTQTTGVRNG